ASGSPGGSSRTTAITSSTLNSSRKASDDQATVQPAPTSSARNGTAATAWPNWPIMVASWVNTGTWAVGNQVAISRTTLIRVAASPTPVSSLAISAVGTSVATASST